MGSASQTGEMEEARSEAIEAEERERSSQRNIQQPEPEPEPQTPETKEVEENPEKYYEKGCILLLQRCFGEARIFFDKFIEKNPENVNALIKRSRCLLEGSIKEFQNAVLDLEKVIKLSPDYVPAYITLSQCFHILHDYFGALDVITKLSKIELDATDVKKELGRRYFYCEKYDKCVEIMDALLELDPLGEDLNLFRGKCFYRKGEFTKAMDSFALAARNENNRDEAIHCLQITRKVKETKMGAINEEVVSGEKMKAEEEGEDEVGNISGIYEEAMVVLEEGFMSDGEERNRKLCEALKKLHYVLSRNENHVGALEARAILAMKCGDYESALSDLSKCLGELEKRTSEDKGEIIVEIALHKGIAEYELGQYKEAIRSFEKVLQILPQHKTAKKLLDMAKADSVNYSKEILDKGISGEFFCQRLFPDDDHQVDLFKKEENHKIFQKEMEEETFDRLCRLVHSRLVKVVIQPKKVVYCEVDQKTHETVHEKELNMKGLYFKVQSVVRKGFVCVLIGDGGIDDRKTVYFLRLLRGKGWNEGVLTLDNFDSFWRMWPVLPREGTKVDRKAYGQMLRRLHTDILKANVEMEISVGQITQLLQYANFLMGMERYDEALKVLYELKRLAPYDSVTYKKIGRIYGKKGEFEKAVEMYTIALKRLEEALETRAGDTQKIVKNCIECLGRRSKCLTLLQRRKEAYADGWNVLKYDKYGLYNSYILGKHLMLIGEHETSLIFLGSGIMKMHSMNFYPYGKQLFGKLLHLRGKCLLGMNELEKAVNDFSWCCSLGTQIEEGLLIKSLKCRIDANKLLGEHEKASKDEEIYRSFIQGEEESEKNCGRFALLVGQNQGLTSCHKDCKDLEAHLSSQGYDCTIILDVTYEQFSEGLEKFIVEKVEKSKSDLNKILFYYSGHGSVVDGYSWLQCFSTSEDDIKVSLNMELRKVLLRLDKIKVGERPVASDIFVVIDACRKSTGEIKQRKLEEKIVVGRVYDVQLVTKLRNKFVVAYSCERGEASQAVEPVIRRSDGKLFVKSSYFTDCLVGTLKRSPRDPVLSILYEANDKMISKNEAFYGKKHRDRQVMSLSYSTSFKIKTIL